MAINIASLDSLKQRFTQDPNGKWYARSYLGSTVAAEDEITGYVSGPVPGEIQDVFAAQRIAVAGGGSYVVTAQTNPLTGGIENVTTAGQSISGVKGSLITCINGNQFQYSGVPKDTSGNGNDLIIKAGITEAQLYANAGYFSSIAASDGFAYLNNSQFAFTMGQDSILVGVIVNDAVPAAAESRFGCANATTRPGFYWSARNVSGAGRVVVTTTGTGGASVQGADTACAFYDSTPHHLAIAIDGPSRSVYVWRDGVLVQSQLNLFPTGGGLCTSNFAFGTNQDTGGAATSVACKHAGFQVARWVGASLPVDIGLIVQSMAAAPRNPLRAIS